VASSHQVAAIVAIVGGIVLAVLLFVPVVAVRYRRAGRLTVGDLVTLVAVTVYGLALWTYTLLPLPDPNDLACRQALTRPFRFVDEVQAHELNSVVDLLRNPAVLQVLFNLLLFVPLGVLLRWRGGIPVWSAGVIGLGVSLLVESTQRTGIWGLYDCAYRYFETDDLIANTVGTLVGAFGVGIVLRLVPERPAPEPAGLTVGRRVVALVSDALVVLLVGAVVVVAWRAAQIDTRPSAPADVDLTVQAWLQWGVPLAIQAVLVLGWGRTVGELVVQVRTVAPGSGATVLARRLVKLLTGIGAFCLLASQDSGPADLALVAMVLVALAAAGLSRDHRGFSNTLAGLEVELVAPVNRAASAPTSPVAARPAPPG
jgi:glycopeptide antibiotics resistance protein